MDAHCPYRFVHEQVIEHFSSPARAPKPRRVFPLLFVVILTCSLLLPALRFFQPRLSGRLEPLLPELRSSAVCQLTGYSLIAAVLAGFFMSRWPRPPTQNGAKPTRFLVHVMSGGIALTLFAIHTNAQLGHNLNLLCSSLFLLLIVSGAAAGLFAKKFQAWQNSRPGRPRTPFAAVHSLVLAPLLIVALFHVLAVYYF